MNQPPYQYPQNPPIQPAYPGAYIRRGRRGCLSRFRGCLVTLVILVLLLVSLWVVSLFVPIPYLVFVNPLPYFTKYSFVIHHGQSAVYAVAWSPNGKRVASVGQERTVQVWDATTGKVLFTYQASLNSPHIPIVWSHDGAHIALSDVEHSFVLLDAATGNTIFTSRRPARGGSSVAWSPDSKRLASVNQDFHIQVWDATTGQPLMTFTSALVDEVAWSQDGKYIASAGQDGAVRIWDATTGGAILNFSSPGKYNITSGLAWSPDGKYIASNLDSLSNESVEIWDATTGHHIFTYSLAKNRVNTLVMAWSPDSKHVAIAGNLDGSIQIWDLLTGKQILSYNGHNIASFLYSRSGEVVRGVTVQAIAWSPDGRRIASTGNEESIQIWNATTGSTLFIFDSQHDSVFGGNYSLNGSGSLAWSPDGKRIALGGSDFAEIWKPE